MSEIGQANSDLPQAVWAGAASSTTPNPKPALPAVAVALLALLVSVVLIGGLLLHHDVSAALRELAAANTTSTAEKIVRSLEQLGMLQLMAILFTSACGVILIGLVLTGYRRIEAHRAQELRQQEQSWKITVRDLRAQLADKQKLELGLRDQQVSLQDRLKSVTKAYTDLKQEFDQTKLAKEVFTQQRRELVRSNDILELNVQARTHQLQKLQRAYESILNSAGEGICGLDTEGKVTFANPAAARMMGLRIDEIVGQKASKVFPYFVTSETPVGAGKGIGSPVEVVATKYNGSKFGVEFLRTPIREEGKVVGEVLLFKDITERKFAAEELTKKAEELARSNKELEQFAFVASHDLQEPLRKIQAFGDRLKAKCDAANLQEGRDYLDRMQNAAARMQTLIFDLLTFSRVISRTEPFVPINLNTVVKDIISDLEVRIEKTSGRVEIGELPTIEADSTQMRQLLQNLIGNALKFHAPGKPPIVRVESRKLETPPANATPDQLEARIEWCEIAIIDNGIGFDERYLDRIFAVFQRLHGRQEYEGTGIGLAVCRRIVDRHSGNITARSKPGEGATFLITLPLTQPTKPEAEA